MAILSPHSRPSAPVLEESRGTATLEVFTFITDSQILWEVNLLAVQSILHLLVRVAVIGGLVSLAFTISLLLEGERLRLSKVSAFISRHRHAPSASIHANRADLAVALKGTPNKMPD